jgi:UDPglucose 6-dehydrogenase
MRLKICVLGQDTLADAVAACCARHFSVTRDWRNGEYDVVWVCYDTPISPQGANADWVIAKILQHCAFIPKCIPILVSSQLPVGSIAELEKCYPAHTFAYSPENIRVAHAESDFMRQERVIVGLRNYASTPFTDILYHLFRPFTDKVIFTDPETAEMCKHALNAWLGMNIAFINEIARVSTAVGADIKLIEQSLLTERRISPHAPLHAGLPFGEGHLARDLQTLERIAEEHDVFTPVLESILVSNGR